MGFNWQEILGTRNPEQKKLQKSPTVPWWTSSSPPRSIKHTKWAKRSNNPQSILFRLEWIISKQKNRGDLMTNTQLEAPYSICKQEWRVMYDSSNQGCRKEIWQELFHSRSKKSRGASGRKDKRISRTRLKWRLTLPHTKERNGSRLKDNARQRSHLWKWWRSRCRPKKCLGRQTYSDLT